MICKLQQCPLNIFKASLSSYPPTYGAFRVSHVAILNELLLLLRAKRLSPPPTPNSKTFIKVKSIFPVMFLPLPNNAQH